MGTERNRKRLKQIEGSLTPDPVVLSWVKEFTKFDSLRDYAEWVSKDLTRMPLPGMFQKIESGISGGLDGYNRSSEDLLHKRCREVRFSFYLLLVLNSQIHEFLMQEEIRLKTFEANGQMVNERVASALERREFCKLMLDTPYPLDADTAAAVSSALKNDVTLIDDWARDIAEQRSNHFAPEVANEEELQATSERLRSALRDLCRMGLIQRGVRVNLHRSLLEFFAEIPLVEEVWIDLMAVKLAEGAAILGQRGFSLDVPADSHPLAPMCPRQRKEIPAEQNTTVASEDEIGTARAEAAARLSTFGGRTRQIDGRPYIHLDDYRGWSGRMAGDDLAIIEGFVTASWNAWVEAAGDNPKLAGIPVSKVNTPLEEGDFFVCEDPARRRRREERALPLRLWMIDKGVANQRLLHSYRNGICQSLIEVRAIANATERLTARYFPGLTILFGSYATALRDLTAYLARLSDGYNELADRIDAEQTRIDFGPKFATRIEQIDPHAVDSAAEKRAVALFETFVALAKAETLSALDGGEKAMRILRPLLRGETGASGAPAL